MKLSLILSCAIVMFSATLVQADSLQDEIDAATKKFCGGIKVTAPTTNKVFSDPKKVKVTVTRVPNSLAKVINGVDIYSINSKGKPTYLGTPWKGTYKLTKSATLTVNVNKVKGLKFPSQFMFRVWVHNTSGPDCTLMSKVFKVKSGSHSNAAEEDEQINALDANIDRGCFGVDITNPATGDHKSSGALDSVQIQRDSSSPVEVFNALTLFKVDLSTREPVQVADAWAGNETVHSMFNIKSTLPTVDAADAAAFAYYYKLSTTTQHEESCDFYSHPFYLDA
ncbi:hypothetical protein J3Q64DRAFT_1711247 [Phycomyces blakesleeanus]|uniref:Uncharacterized protein n=2 Tax=Phycomyces blakesleeanus TaxID=4837 RepID=A0A162ZS11_PHYB8|nr:hypothetical protein PHYBLDRAFT_77375 [Phycomyces blakesleeanus NRRL 1555(-)]OAD68681.1 hypothetical protein PHYBLDRAFT_77375 [Phycomyces blakesleeanus NRRL 1555(-)]|eukprot:XP_018286721.1 hypothetical protein PHYBLDRAFT_77375 [Phycomyces blakesleeanus NRRL 1555(-)]